MVDGNNLPAEALNAGEIDGLFCNSLQWMNTFNETNNANLAMAFPYYYSYSGLYSTKYTSPEEIPEGGKVIISSGITNIDGCLEILETAGLIKLAEQPTEGEYFGLIDIAENPKNLEIIPTELTTAMRGAEDVDAVVASAVIVRDSGLMDVSSHMAISRKESMTPQGLIINEEDIDAEWVKLADELMNTQECYDKFNELFEGTFILYSEIDNYQPEAASDGASSEAAETEGASSTAA